MGMEHNGPVAVVRLSGRLKPGRECEGPEARVRGLVRGNRKWVVLDLADLEYLESTVGTLVVTSAVAHKAGGAVCLAGASGRVLGVLKMTRMDVVLGMHASAAKAASGRGTGATPPLPAPDAQRGGWRASRRRPPGSPPQPR
jgi:anti-anti-sigma factor